MKLLERLSLEDNQSKEEKETEIAIYCKIGDFDALEQCNRKEQQVQLEGQFSNGVKCRVRSVKEESKDIQYFFTYKLKDEDGTNVDSCSEHTVQVDLDFFNGFKKIAERMLVKTRYVFFSKDVAMTIRKSDDDEVITIPNVEYEVDVYEMENGEICEWCKIDVEVDGILNHLSAKHPDVNGIKLNIKVKHLPFKPTEAILGTSVADKDTITSIWEKFKRKVKDS